MLPHSKRVSRVLFEKTQRKSKLFHSVSFSARIGEVPHEPSRFSFVISKKVAAKATKRNRMRRHGYEAVQSFLKGLKPGFVVIFYPKKTAKDLSFEQLKLEI